MGTVSTLKLKQVVAVWVLTAWAILLCIFCQSSLCAADAPAPGGVTVLSISPGGAAEVLPSGATAWQPLRAGRVLQGGERVRTGKNTRAVLLLSDKSQISLGEFAEMEIQQPSAESASITSKLWRGVLYFLHRDRPGSFNFNTPTTSGAIRGTEFNLAVAENGRTVVTLLDGAVDLENAQGKLSLKSNQEAIVEPGQAPALSPALEIQLKDAVQWRFYYPGVIHLDELGLSAAERETLGESIKAYQAGDLLQALAKYPAGRTPASEQEKVLYAALLLSAGKAKEAEAALPQAVQLANERPRRLASALRKMIDLVKGVSVAGAPIPTTATEWLVESYRLQALGHLDAALTAARSSTGLATNFSFGWERVAELEFGFGRIHAAEEALDRSLALSPRNAQAVALKGFILSANNKMPQAAQAFRQAIELDDGLANGWLGQGLVQIRQGRLLEGRQNLETAALVEPQRSFLRSYLGKAFSVTRDNDRALHELNLAKDLDSRDPTPWLYSALILREENRINEAVRNLETSLSLNENRHVYRSEFLLEQDRAVRSSSLANIYRAAEMREVSVREAARAVSYDYANYSSHQFLSESYNELRDPTRFNLRYETPWFNELLLANLLSPVGGTPLSQNISQQEYARLFERNRIGLTTDTSYRSDVRWTELASQFGRVGNTSWALDLDYQHNHGVRPNNELNRIEWYTTVKQQLTPQDSILLLTKYQDYHSGDNFQYYDPAQARPNFFYDETQSPIILGGYHREWSPGSHTLLLAGHLENEQRFGDKVVPLPILFRTAGGPVISKGTINFDAGLESEFDAYTAELQQIQQWARHTIVVGGRYQNGDFTTRSLITNPSVSLPGVFAEPPADISSVNEFERASGYAYYTLEPIDRLFLTAGVAYDYVRFPENFRAPPINTRTDSRQRWNPKASILWNPIPALTLRGAYTRSLGGVTLDQSYRLEPSQLAGFPQAFRSIIPESLVGSVAAPEFDTWAAGVDVKLPTMTYLGVDAALLESDVDQTIGVFDYDFVSMTPSSTPQRLKYREQSIGFTANQLLNNEWSLGAGYRFTRSMLDSSLPEVPAFLTPSWDTHNEADLQRIDLRLLYNHSSGFFGLAESVWYLQDNSHAGPGLADESFNQVNVYAGYRFRRQRAELTVGVMNLAGNDYRLNPLNLYEELPRSRVFFARARVRF